MLPVSRWQPAFPELRHREGQDTDFWCRRVNPLLLALGVQPVAAFTASEKLGCVIDSGEDANKRLGHDLLSFLQPTRFRKMGWTHDKADGFLELAGRDE